MQPTLDQCQWYVSTHSILAIFVDDPEDSAGQVCHQIGMTDNDLPDISGKPVDSELIEWGLGEVGILIGPYEPFEGVPAGRVWGIAG